MCPDRDKHAHQTRQRHSDQKKKTAVRMQTGAKETTERPVDCNLAGRDNLGQLLATSSVEACADQAFQSRLSAPVKSCLPSINSLPRITAFQKFRDQLASKVAT
jgi:hypothetical protein